MAGADLSRAKQARLDAIAHARQVCEHVGGSHGQVPLDILEETPFGSDLADDPLDMRPEVTGVACPRATPGEAERLAGVAARDDRNLSTPRAAVEGRDIIPDRRVIQGLVSHPGHEDGRRECFPLDVTDSLISGFSDMEAELQSANAGAEGETGEPVNGSRWGM